MNKKISRSLYIILYICGLSQSFMWASCFDLTETGDLIWQIGVLIGCLLIIPFGMIVYEMIKSQRAE